MDLKCPFCGGIGCVEENIPDGQHLQCPHCSKTYVYRARKKQQCLSVKGRFCEACGAKIATGATFCGACGHRVGSVPNTESNQSAGMSRQDQFFDRIERLERSRMERELNKSDKSRISFIMLGLFLGEIGIHDFYLGKGGLGAVHIVLCILGIPLCAVGVGVLMLVGNWIWAIIEVCTTTVDLEGEPLG